MSTYGRIDIEKACLYVPAARFLLRLRPPNVPIAYWEWLHVEGRRSSFMLRMLAVYLTLTVFVFLIGFVSIMKSKFAHLHGMNPMGFVVLANVHIWGGMVVYYWQTRRVLARFGEYLKSHQGLVCFDCGYSIRGLPENYLCPECKWPFEAEDLRIRWMWCFENTCVPFTKGRPQLRF